MQIYILSIIVGVLTYAILRLILPVSEKEVLQGRVTKYFAVSELDDVAEQVMKERYNNSRKSNEVVNKLISRDFSEYVVSSGVKLTPAEFLYSWIGVALVPAMLLGLIRANILTIFAMGLLGVVLPPFLLIRARKKKQDLFTTQLGEALIVMGNAIRGGFSFTQAMESVATEMQPPISLEFGKSIREMQFGVTQEEALKKMADRIKNEDLNLLVSAVLTSAQVGGNLSEILETISATIKDRIRIKQEVRVLTSTGRTSAIIIALLPIFIVLALMFINPDYFGLFLETDMGKIMVIVAIILELVGFLFIRKISDIQY